MPFPPLDRIRTALIIGAYDAINHDACVPALLASGVRATMVEPVPTAFAKLQRNVPEHDLINAAIYDRTGVLPMLIVDPDFEAEYEPPEWDMWGGASSLKEHVRNNIQNELGPQGRMLEVDVQCYTFEDFAALRPQLQFDYMQVDTEGSDWIIFSQIDLDKYGTIAINVETMWLTPKERKACRAKVRGWTIVQDTGCILEAYR